MVVVTVTYDNNTKVLPATLTVTTAAMLKTLTFGDMTSDDTTTYPVDKITQTDLARGVYWYPVEAAKDDSEVDADADRLNGSQNIWIKYQDQYYTEASADGITVRNCHIINQPFGLTI